MGISHLRLSPGGYLSPKVIPGWWEFSTLLIPGWELYLLVYTRGGCCTSWFIPRVGYSLPASYSRVYSFPLVIPGCGNLLINTRKPATERSFAQGVLFHASPFHCWLMLQRCTYLSHLSPPWAYTRLIPHILLKAEN